MYRSLVGIGMLCGLMIALVYDGTRPAIERNRAAALERAVFSVLPEATQRRTYVPDDDGVLEPGSGVPGERLHAGFDAQGNLVGVAIEASGMGYADTIAVLYGYAPQRDAIVGIEVLASKETPGLGDKIETDADFLTNFDALDVRLDETGTRLDNGIVAVKQGEKTAPWEIDGITGATISSVAIADILASSSARWVPFVKPRLDEFEPPDEGAGQQPENDDAS